MQDLRGVFNKAFKRFKKSKTKINYLLLNYFNNQTGVCKIYEEHLKRMNPASASITYDISQLFDFIDDLADLCCMVYQQDTQLYAPFNKVYLIY